MTGKMSKVYKHTVEVPFHDTDMAGVVHFTNLLRYVEMAEHAAMESVSVPPMSQNGGFPKVHVECDYSAPVRFRDQVEVEMSLERISKGSLSWAFKLCVRGQKVAQGKIVTAHVTAQGHPDYIPEAWRNSLDALR